MTHLYKRYMRLLEKWPIDPNKSPDLGQHIRDQIKVLFPKGDKSKIADEKECLRNIESLERLAANTYGKKYPFKFKNTTTGLPLELLTVALSPEGLAFLQERKKGFIAKLWNTVHYYFLSSRIENTPEKKT